MLYALLGDLHSNIEDTKAVLAHIQQTAEEATIIGLGIYMNALLVRKGTNHIWLTFAKGGHSRK